MHTAWHSVGAQYMFAEVDKTARLASETHSASLPTSSSPPPVVWMSNGDSERVTDMSGSQTAQDPLPQSRGSRWRVADEQLAV